MRRTLYLVCYDVRDPDRLRRVGRYLLGYRVEGQRSAYECWLTASEYQEMLATLAALIDPAQDRVHVFALDPRQKPFCYGLARHFEARSFMVT